MSRHLVRRTYRKGKGHVRSGTRKGVKYGKRAAPFAVLLV